MFAADFFSQPLGRPRAAINSCGLHCHGRHSYGLHSYGLHSYDLNSYGPQNGVGTRYRPSISARSRWCRRRGGHIVYGRYSYGGYSYGLHSYGPQNGLTFVTARPYLREVDGADSKVDGTSASAHACVRRVMACVVMAYVGTACMAIA